MPDPHLRWQIINVFYGERVELGILEKPSIKHWGTAGVRYDRYLLFLDD